MVAGAVALPSSLSADLSGLFYGLLRLFVIRGHYPGPIFIFATLAFAFYPLLHGDPSTRDGSLKGRLSYIFPSAIYRHSSARIDYWSYALNTLLGPGVSFAALVGFEETVRLALVREFGEPALRLPPGWITITLEFIVVFLLLEFWNYIVHYLLHKVPALWRIHRCHHSAEVLTPFTGPRAHPIEMFAVITIPNMFTGLCAGAFVYFVGGPLSAITITLIAAVQIFSSVNTAFRHSHMWVSYGPFWNRIFYSPAMHHIHHSTLLKHRDKNIGQILCLWDWVFGTLYVPEGREVFPLGINDYELGENNPHHSVWSFYIEPLITMFRPGAAGKPQVSAASRNVPVAGRTQRVGD